MSSAGRHPPSSRRRLAGRPCRVERVALVAECLEVDFVVGTNVAGLANEPADLRREHEFVSRPRGQDRPHGSLGGTVTVQRRDIEMTNA
jgi:hypothetical protein